MNMSNKTLLSVAAFAALFAVAGCTPAAREDLGQAGENVSQATEKSAKGTAEAVDNAAEKTADATKEAAAATADAAKDAAQTTEKAVVQTGAAVVDASKDAASATEKAAVRTGTAIAKGTSAIAMTPQVKSAILADKNVNIDGLNVDTVGKTITLMGVAPTAAQKTQAEADAKKALSDNPDYTLMNKITVGGGKM